MNNPSKFQTTDASAPTVDRRHFLKRLGLAGAAAPLGATLLSGGAPAIARAQSAPAGYTQGDIAILRFLAMAELLGQDLFGQFAEVAVNNKPFQAALQRINFDLPNYLKQTARDEASHAVFVNAYLQRIGQAPVNLDAFRTLPGSQATGSARTARLTNLSSLSPDTAFYNRFRKNVNPDFGPDAEPIATIVNQPGIPTDDSFSADRLDVAAHTAAFYFPFQSQGEVGLYGSFMPKITNPEVSEIFAGIRPIEVVHLDIASAALVTSPGLIAGADAQFPDLLNRHNFARKLAPGPTTFISGDLPAVSVARPSSTAVIGAVQIVRRLTAAGLFNGQSATFMSMGMEMAMAADAAVRNGA